MDEPMLCSTENKRRLGNKAVTSNSRKGNRHGDNRDAERRRLKRQEKRRWASE